MNNQNCNVALQGRLKDNELCTSALKVGVGACEVSRAGRWICIEVNCVACNEIKVDDRKAPSSDWLREVNIQMRGQHLESE